LRRKAGCHGGREGKTQEEISKGAGIYKFMLKILDVFRRENE